jgi:hypothetical protein
MQKLILSRRGNFKALVASGAKGIWRVARVLFLVR